MALTMMFALTSTRMDLIEVMRVVMVNINILREAIETYTLRTLYFMPP